MTNFHTNTKRGTSLIEIMIVVAVIIIVFPTVTEALISFMRVGDLRKDALHARYFADEGTEAVVNIIATNWLRFPFDKSSCWNIGDENISTTADCQSNKIENDTSYILDWEAAPDATNNKNSYFKWRLVPSNVNGGLDLNKNNTDDMDPFCLKRIEAVGTRKNLFVQNSDIGTGCSGFYREIKIYYPKNDQNGPAKSMRIISKVQWLHKSKVKTVKTSTDLNNNI